MSFTPEPQYTVPGMSLVQGSDVATLLQKRLYALNDLALTLKHAHWNVTGTHFIAVHEMLDPQVDAVRTMIDDVAERIATLGVAPIGTPGALVAGRDWDDYSLGRADAMEHVAALDSVYTGVISDHRAVAAQTAEPDPVTQDLLIAQLHELEKFQWFLRAHLENQDGSVRTASAQTERSAADLAGAQG